MEESRLVSIVVPVYNVQDYVEKCILSIINQTYTNLEIILVDDGSKDNSGAICDKYEKIDSRIKVIHQQNGGLSAARNSGIKIAKGEYIGFVDSDDYIEPEMYERMLARILENDADMSICSYKYVDEYGKSIDKSNANNPIVNGCYQKEEIFKELNRNDCWFYITAWNKLYKRSMFDNICFPVGKLNEDVFVAHELVDLASKIVLLEDYLYNYVQRTNSIVHGKYTVKRFDEIEGFLSRIDYYRKHQYDEFLEGSIKLCWDRYFFWRMNIKVETIEDKRRRKTIDDSIRTMIYRSSGNIKRKMQIAFPNLFFYYMELKK